MKAIFVCDLVPNFNLPPAVSSTGIQLQYPRPGVPGLMDGGYSMVGRVPQAPTCIVQVDASAVTIAAMKADPAYLWLEDVVDG